MDHMLKKGPDLCSARVLVHVSSIFMKLPLNGCINCRITAELPRGSSCVVLTAVQQGYKVVSP